VSAGVRSAPRQALLALFSVGLGSAALANEQPRRVQRRKAPSALRWLRAGRAGQEEGGGEGPPSIDRGGRRCQIGPATASRLPEPDPGLDAPDAGRSRHGQPGLAGVATEQSRVQSETSLHSQGPSTA